MLVRLADPTTTGRQRTSFGLMYRYPSYRHVPRGLRYSRIFYLCSGSLNVSIGLDEAHLRPPVVPPKLVTPLLTTGPASCYLTSLELTLFVATPLRAESTKSYPKAGGNGGLDAFEQACSRCRLPPATILLL